MINKYLMEVKLNDDDSIQIDMIDLISAYIYTHQYVCLFGMLSFDTKLL